MARTQVLKILHSQIPTKQQMLLGEYERKNKEENHQELQDQDLLGSPHLEEEWNGGNVDLDLLSLFPQKVARIIGEIERSQVQENVSNGGERS